MSCGRDPNYSDRSSLDRPRLRPVAIPANMHGMEVNETTLVLRLRDPDLPRGMRGFQEDATLELLRKAASAVERLAGERDRLRSDLEAARASAEEGQRGADADAIGRALLTATSMSDQIVAQAKEQAERRVAEAEQEAERVLAAARTEAGALERGLEDAREQLEREAAATRERLEQQLASERSRLEGEVGELQRATETQRERLEAERDELLAGAKDAAERMLADARAELARLRQEAGEIDAVIDEKKRALVDVARAALEQLDSLETGDSTPSRQGELLGDLHRPVEAHRSRQPAPSEAEPSPETS
jgi:cell division septum initiation protein DivIVA